LNSKHNGRVLVAPYAEAYCTFCKSNAILQIRALMSDASPLSIDINMIDVSDGAVKSFESIQIMRCCESATSVRV
jgi:hypothetical protein